MTNTAHLHQLARLRGQIAAIERGTAGPPGSAPPPLWRLGAPAIDRALPRGGLEANAVHELVPDTAADLPAAFGFAAVLAGRAARAAARPRGGIVWAQTRAAAHERGRPYGAGLARLGLDPAALVRVEAGAGAEVLWALEEALRSGAVDAAVGHVAAPGFTATRRLALAAAASKTPCLLISGPGRAEATAARTRWRIAAAPSRADRFDPAAPGAPRWRLALVRAKGGTLGEWKVEFDDATGALRLAPDVADRPAAAGAPDRRGAVRRAAS